MNLKKKVKMILKIFGLIVLKKAKYFKLRNIHIRNRFKTKLICQKIVRS